jgi:F-type H+-transporting ATPase subunit gamma
MATLKEVEGRIKSTANIAKITKAMQMVAAAKLRGAEERLDKSRPLMAMIEEFSEKIEMPESKNTTFIPINTDRGLCGGVNTNLVKRVANEMAPSEEAAGATVQIVGVGDKGRSQINRLMPGSLVATVSGVFAQVLPNFGQASVISEKALETGADKYSIVYNKFFSAIKQEPTRIDILSGDAMAAMETDPLMDYETEKTRAELSAALAEFNLATAVYAAMSENACSEIASKMAAMDNATRNCESLVEKLQVQYNKARQAIITTELIEIISGAEALHG